MELVNAAVFGGLGGVLRAVVGWVKAIKDKKKFNLPYFMTTSALGVVVGMITGMLLSLDWRLAFVSGYAGTDVLEGIVRVFKEGRAYGVIKK